MNRPEEIVERTVVLGYIRTSQRAATDPALQLGPPPRDLVEEVAFPPLNRVDEAQGPIECRWYGRRSDRSQLYQLVSVDGSLHYVPVYGGGMGGLKTRRSGLLKDSWRSLSKADNPRNGVRKWDTPVNRFQVTHQSFQRLDTSPGPNYSFLHPNTTVYPGGEAGRTGGFVGSENVSRLK